MAQLSKAEILFLFEDEIRTAAASLARFKVLNDRPETDRDDEALARAIRNTSKPAPIVGVSSA